MKKTEWARSLKIGDEVHDCTGKIQKIKELYSDDNPYEIVVVLEDGRECRVMPCISPAEGDCEIEW